MYLNDQIVDAAMYKFWDTSKEKDQTMFLTTYTCNYLSKSGSGDNISKRNLLRLMQSRMPLNVKRILIPVHVSNFHWGLARIHIPTKLIYFDDSLRWASPVMLLHDLEHLIELLSQLLPNVNLKSRSWLRGAMRLERFGMPLQPSVAGREGSASCDIAVILAARDFCNRFR